MRVSVILTRQVVAVIGTRRRKPLQPLVDVFDQALFGVVDVNGGRDVHRGDQRQPFFYRALGDRAGDIIGDVNVFAALLGVEGQILRKSFHFVLSLLGASLPKHTYTLWLPVVK